MTPETLISIFGSRAELARAIGEGETTVRNWFARRSIPARYDRSIIEAAILSGHFITPDDLFSVRQSLASERAA